MNNFFAGTGNVVDVRVSENQRFVGFRLAIKAGFERKENETVSKVVFMNVSYFPRNEKDGALRLTKGQKVSVCGSLEANEWQDKDGNRRYEVRVLAESIDITWDKDKPAETKPEEEPKEEPKETAKAQNNEITPASDEELQRLSNTPLSQLSEAELKRVVMRLTSPEQFPEESIPF